VIVLFTDFGLAGPYVGQMQAVLSARAPEVPVVSLFADVPAFEPRLAAYLLAAYVTEFPAGTVFLAVVDPGVGGGRAPAVVEADGRWYVGPENGLFAIVARRAQGFRWWCIDWRPERLSASFHGRDLFAPVAAHLALGARLEEAGDAIDASSLSSLDLPTPELGSDRVKAHAIHVDGYGNVTLDLDASMLADGPFAVGDRIDVRAPDGRFEALWVRTFSDTDPGDLLLFEDSSGALALAASGGHAAGLLDLRPGTGVELRPQ